MKILIVHASAGAGHQMAAEAIHQGIKKYTDFDTTLIDGLDYTSAFYKKSYRDTYTFLISKTPWLWGVIYWLFDIRCLQWFFSRMRRLINSINFSGLQKLLEEEQFDYVISTHFMPNEVVSALKRSEKISSKLICIITDYNVHRIWLGSGVDTYSVATDWTKERLKNLGVSLEKIFPTGIPANERFTQDYDIIDLKRRLDVQKDTFTVLLATGSFGIGPIEEIVQQLIGFQVIVICGHNKKLYERLNQKNYAMVKVCGLVDNMNELMAVSDVMVTKPGGLSITEALVSQLPLVFFNAIPGQEVNNIKVLEAYGMGCAPSNIAGIVDQLTTLKNSKDYFMTILKRTKTLARPSAVRDIVSLIK